MMKTLLSLFLALHSSAAFLTCDYCHEMSTSCENNTSQDCNDTQMCSSSALHNNILPEYKVSTFRGCALPHGCHSGDYSFSASQGKFFQLKLSCCQTNECNKEPVHLPPREDLSPNGLQCPACFSIHSMRVRKGCSGLGIVSCLANETKCIDYASVVFYQEWRMQILKFQGCATENFCALNGGNLMHGDLGLHNINVKCSDAVMSSKQIDREG